MNKVVINGKKYEIPNGNISIINGKIYVNGKEFTEELNSEIVDVVVYGDVSQINCEGNVVINGNAETIYCGGNCEVEKDVSGDIKAYGSVNCGNVKGNVSAGGIVKCKSFGKSYNEMENNEV